VNSILSIRGVSLAFSSAADGGRGLPLLDALSLEIPQGQTTALVGGNGAGKTTLFNIISGFQHADAGKIILNTETGARSFRAAKSISPHTIARLGVGRLFQGRQLSPSLSLLDNFKLAADDTSGELPFSRLLRPAALRRAEEAKEERARAILEDLFGPGNKYLDMLNVPGGAFSYGEQRLLSLARLLMSGNTRLLLLDEATAGVNPAICETIGTVIQRMESERAITVFLIEHNLPFVRKVAHNCAYMRDGKIAKMGAVNDVLDSSEVRESYLGLAGLSEEKASEHQVEKALDVPHGPVYVLEIDHLSGGYDSNRDILQDVELRVAAGESVGVIGLNGSGKSTLGKAIMNLLPCRSGRVRLGGNDISSLPTARLAREGVGLMMQGAPVFDQLTVAENIRLAALAAHGTAQAANDNTEDTAISPRLRADKLSGGQRHWLALRLALTKPVKLLILDEPSAGLDPAAASTLYRRLTELREKSGIAILLIEQNVRLARDFCRRLLVMNQGKLEKNAGGKGSCPVIERQSFHSGKFAGIIAY